MPGVTWLAEKGRADVEVASAALRLLEQDGWVTPDPSGGYVICVPIPMQIPAPRTWPTPVRSVTGAKRSGSPKPTPKQADEKVRDRMLGRYSTYLIGIDGLPFVKIGHTTSSPEARIKSLQTGQPMNLHLLWSVAGDYELDLHCRFANYRVRGEWFDLSSLGDPVAVMEAAVKEIKAAESIA
ncbi:GIY-YIG nuclease family protein [Streptomyces canus]|uniref:GIY-YIG nuclease family protein n=1 Tax=Streptomyces canus TaxID=58343 RepID=UPI003870E50C